MTDVRCGRDGVKSASTTETATIEAGSAVAFHVKTYNDPMFNNGIFHPGPAQVYMSKSENLETDVGDGDWFKIYYLGPDSDTTWATDRATQVCATLVFYCLEICVLTNSQINFTIPESTPPGTCEYLSSEPMTLYKLTKTFCRLAPLRVAIPYQRLARTQPVVR